MDEILDEGKDKKNTDRILILTRLAAIDAELNAIQLQIENILKQMEVASTMENRKLLDVRLSEKVANKSSLEEEKATLKSRESDFKRESGSVNAALDSLKKLDQSLKNAQKSDSNARDLRLKLRQKLKGLIAKIEVAPEGWPRYIPEVAQRALEDLSVFFRQGTEEHEWLKNYLSFRVENPKGYRAFLVTFVTGSMRGISPGFAPHAFRVEWDKEENALYAFDSTKGLTDDRIREMLRFENRVRSWELIYTTGGEEELDKIWMKKKAKVS